MRSFSLILILFLLMTGIQTSHVHANTGGKEKGTYWVFAPSGLNMRSGPSSSASKVMTVNLGTKVEVLAPASSQNLTVDGLKGGMAKVKVGTKEGYMFDAYLSPWPIPDDPYNIKAYRDLIRNYGLAVSYEQHYYDYDGYYSEEEGLHTENDDWQEAFIIAKQLGVPATFDFPKAKPGDQTIPNPNKASHVWSDELVVRCDNAGKFTEILYYRRQEGGGSSTSIKKNENSGGLVIMIGGIAD